MSTSGSGLQAARERRTSANQPTPTMDAMPMIRRSRSTASVSGQSRRSMAHSQNSGSVFFQSRINERIAETFVARLTNNNIVADDFSNELRFVPWEGQVAMMMVDISGYSNLAHTLESKGAHALAEAVNSCFKPILALIRSLGGDVLKFAGDALLAVWNEPELKQSVHLACAAAMQLQLKCGEYTHSGTGCVLKLHIGVTCGLLHTNVFCPKGDSRGEAVMQSAFHFVGGQPLSDIEVVVDNAPTGTNAVSAAVRAEAGDLIEVTAIDGVSSAFRLKGAKPVDAKTAPLNLTSDDEAGVSASDAVVSSEGDDDLDDLGDEAELEDPEHLEKVARVNDMFLPPTVLTKLRMGVHTDNMCEMRQLFILFIKCVGEFENSEDWFEEVHSVLSRGRAPVTQVIEDDKGIHIIAALNLYTAEDGAADAAVKITKDLLEREIGCVIGIAGGPCFCGIVGSDEVCRWDITGNAVVRACRLMQFAEQDGKMNVAVDMSVAEGISDGSMLTMHTPEANIKGCPEPIPVFSVSAKQSDVFASICGINEYCKTLKAPERAAVKAAIVAGPPVVSVLVRGVPGSGKKTAILSALHELDIAPSLHRTPRGCEKLDACHSMVAWFGSGSARSEELSSIANSLGAALKAGHASRSKQLVHQIVRIVLSSGLRVAIVLDHAQYVDNMSLRLMRETVEIGMRLAAEAAESERITGRLVWAMSFTPQYGGQSVAAIRSAIIAEQKSDQKKKANASTPEFTVVTCEPCTSKELGDWFESFAFWGQDKRISHPLVGASSGNLMSYSFFVKYVATHQSEPLAKYYRKEMKAEEVPAVLNPRGGIETSDIGCEVYADMDFIENPSLLYRMNQLFDTLQPRLQILLKCIAVLSTTRNWIPQDLVTAIASNFLPGTTADMMRFSIPTLEELQLIQVVHPRDRSKPVLVRSYLNAMRLQLLKLMTPTQIEHISHSGATRLQEEAFAVREADSIEGYVDQKLHVASLFLRSPDNAGNKASAEMMMVEALRMIRKNKKKWETVSFPFDDPEHRIAWEMKKHDLSSTIAIDGKVASFRPITLMKDSDFLHCGDIEDVKNFEPPLVLGPLSGLYGRFTRQMTYNTVVALGNGDPLLGPFTPITAEEIQSLIDRFEKFVPQYPDERLKMGYSLEEEAALLRDLLAPPANAASSIQKMSSFLEYVQKAVLPRSRRVEKFASSVIGYRDVDFDEEAATTDSERIAIRHRRALLNAFQTMADVGVTGNDESDDAACRQALVDLAQANWSSPFPYMVPAKLRDAVLFHWICPCELKAIVLLFLIERQDMTAELMQRTVYN